jgi:hypothetical protein
MSSVIPSVTRFANGLGLRRCRLRGEAVPNETGSSQLPRDRRRMFPHQGSDRGVRHPAMYAHSITNR